MNVSKSNFPLSALSLSADSTCDSMSLAEKGKSFVCDRWIESRVALRMVLNHSSAAYRIRLHSALPPPALCAKPPLRREKNLFLPQILL